LNTTCRPRTQYPNEALGGVFATGLLTVTERLMLPVAPSSSVTVSVTVYVPAVA
jgi:hypothetical protein